MKSRKYNEYTQPIKERNPPPKKLEQDKEARESTCSDEIYCNTGSPEETAPAVPVHGHKKEVQKSSSTAKLTSKVKKSSLQTVKQPSELDTKNEAEGFYSSLDLSQKEEQDVYEAQLVIKSEDKPKTEVLPEMKETHQEPDEEKGNVETGQEHRGSLQRVMLYLKSKKTIVAVMGIFFVTFVASTFGSLIAGTIIIKSMEIFFNRYFEQMNGTDTIPSSQNVTIRNETTTNAE